MERKTKYIIGTAAMLSVAGGLTILAGNIGVFGSGNSVNTNSHNTTNNTTNNIFVATLQKLGILDNGTSSGAEIREVNDALGVSTSSPVVNLSAGLEAVVKSVGRSKDFVHLSVAVSLTNKGKNTLLLSLAGPTSAQDNNGGNYWAVDSASGIGWCPDRSNVVNCINNSNVLVGMTQIDPGSQINMSFALSGSASKGPLASFSTVLVGRVVTDPDKESSLSDEDKKKSLRSFSLSAPPVKVVDAK